jgi:hypothetical protein
MPTTIDSAGITFNDATSLTSANIGTAQLVNGSVIASKLAANSVGATQIADGSVTAAKLGTNEQKQIAKAWVNFDGNTSPGTISSSFNVSSVTRNATGDFTVNFTTALVDANYAVAGTASGGIGASVNHSTSTVNSLRIFVYNSNGTAVNLVDTSVIIFGN